MKAYETENNKASNRKAKSDYADNAFASEPEIHREKKQRRNNQIYNSCGERLFEVLLYGCKKIGNSKGMFIPCEIAGYIGDTCIAKS